MDNKIGLVLEGGGMRGSFTAGVLDCFLDNKIYFPYVIGSSAGASNGLSYASRQRGRARACNIDALEKFKYAGLKAFFKCGNIMDYGFMFSDMPLKLYPYDFEAYGKSGNFIITATNCLTGEAVYFGKQPDIKSLLNVCKASCSLPYLCPMVDVGGVPMLDGGIADSIPQDRAESDGYFRNVVVLTRNKGYRKREKPPFISRFAYMKYPNLQKALAKRGSLYNKSLAKIEKLEDKGEIIVIRPINELKVRRIETNTDNLAAIYDEGYKCALNALKKISLMRV